MIRFVFCILALLISTGAQAHKSHHHHVRAAHSDRHYANHGHYRHYATRGSHQSAAGMVTVPTAAGISITVNPSFAPNITAFIADIVAQGYKPRHIGCFATGGHVANSRHYAGAACDLDQTGWGRTAAFMHHVSALAARHGLRDGCSFGDCGHIDDGQPIWHRRR